MLVPANAPIIVSNISDTGITVNLSGQSTGAFDVGLRNWVQLVALVLR